MSIQNVKWYPRNKLPYLQYNQYLLDSFFTSFFKTIPSFSHVALDLFYYQQDCQVFLSLPRNINWVSDFLSPYMPHFSLTPCAPPTSDMRISNIHVHHLWASRKTYLVLKLIIMPMCKVSRLPLYLDFESAARHGKYFPVPQMDPYYNLLDKFQKPFQL